MKNILLTLTGFAVGASLLFFTSFKARPTQATAQYVIINALESVVSGGTGRSKGIITYPDGKQEEFDLENHYSMVGVNFGNIKDNDKKINDKINVFAKQGYRVVGQSAGGAGVYCTRIVMVKSE